MGRPQSCVSGVCDPEGARPVSAIQGQWIGAPERGRLSAAIGHLSHLGHDGSPHAQNPRTERVEDPRLEGRIVDKGSARDPGTANRNAGMPVETVAS